jgi:hypothetical protein
MNRIRQITLFAVGVLVVVVSASIYLFEPLRFAWAAITVWVLLLRYAFTEHPVLFWSYVFCCVMAVVGYRRGGT